MPAPLDDILGNTGTPPVPAIKPTTPAIAAKPVTPAPAAVPSFREFSDYPTIRKDIFDNVLTSMKTKFPMENTRYQLRVADLAYKDPKDFSLADQKKAILRGESLHWPLHGTWELVDKASQKVVDKKSSVIAHVPYITNRGTFIYNGSEYSVANQMRMKPGVFTRVKENGFVEAHVNVKPGTGPSMRIHMEPETAIFRVEVGQSNLKLYPILKAMGISDKELETNWGREILQKNIAAEDPRAVSRAFAKLVSTRADQAVGGDDETSLFKMSSVAGDLELPTWLVAAGDVTDYVTDRALLLALKKLQKEKEEYRIPRHDKNKLLASVLEKTSEDAMPDVVPGGVGDDLKASDVDIDQLVLGVETELEHTDNEELALDIAKDHLSEDPSYYTRLQKMEKKAKLDAAASDRRWTQLWYTGKIEASRHNDDEWVLLTVHRGLCEASYDSLKAEGVSCSPKFSNPHISVLRPEEVEELKKRYGNAWKGAAKVGQSFRFKLKRIVSLIPAGWTDKYDRVWFLECESPDLNKLRKDLGFFDLPRNPKSGNDMRFHITFAVHSNTVKEACELFLEKRAALSVTTPSAVTTPAPAVKDNSGQQLLDVFNKMELDPDVTEATLGQRFTNMNIPTLLRTTQKLLNVNAGKEDTDDRDSLAFQTLHSAEDFFPERVKKDAGQISRKMLWRATTKGNVQSIPSGVLTPQLSGVLLKSGLGMPLEEINPIDAYDQSIRILRLGEGGISSVQAIPEEARSVQPSHFGFIDPVRAPESSKMGIDSRVTHRTKKGKDGNFYTDMTDARTGKPVTISAAQASRSVVAFPGEMAREGNKVRAMINSRRVGFVDKSKVDFELPDPVQMFTATSNLVPLTSGIKGGRLLMGAKYFVQSLPLKNPEVPLVQNLADPKTGASFDDLYGDRVGAVKAEDNGVVVDVGGDYVKVRYANGETKSHELYQNFPFNRKSSIHNTPVVKIGDTLAKGQVLAKSNYTDDKGSLALGTNLRTAYMIYKGHNYEDATVISESAAKRLASERMYQNLTDPEHNVDKNAYVSMYPTKFNKAQMSTIDKSGVVKPGTIVRYGDPLTLALKKNEVTAVHRSHKPVWGDSALTWGHEYEGVVTDVDKTKEGAWNVTVKAYVPAQEGDKLAGRYGDKGVIAKILPDDQMPHDKEGKPFEILLNPLGVISRGNPSQVMEALLGKVARKTGSAYKLPSFRQGSWIDFVEGELKKHGVNDTEDLIDPVTGKKVPKILTGERFMLKLHHTAESKGRGRDVGAYTSEGIPARGGELGSKRVSTMEQYSLLSHGATEVLRDAQVVRGQRNDDYWRAFRMGMTPPSPKVPFIYDKFLSSMKGAGINVKKEGNRMHLFAMTDKDIEAMSHGALKNSDTVRSSDMKELDGGLFDRKTTGGHNGDWWSHIDLVEPMPNPVMEEPIRNLLGLTQKRYEDILAGKDSIGGKSGGEAIRDALARINIDSAIQQAQTTIQDGKKTKRDAAVKQLGYLKGFKKYGLEPKDLILTKVPVLPPNMRPITAFQGMTMTADANVLYKDLMLANNSLGRLKGKVEDSSLGEERLQLYNSFKAASGLGDPVQAKTLEKGVKGLLAHVFGVGSPKTGLFQRRVLGSPVDVVGRATITPNPELDMDQVGLPEDKAWTIYRPFITRRLVRRGMPATEAAKAVADRSDVAKRAMLEEMGERPVLINRAPTLHRYGFMASWPVLTKNDTLQMSPVVTNGFTADFDGDAMNYHVPVTEEAVKEAIEKMMPSKNLKAVKDFKVHYMPRNEFLLGLYLASSADNKNEPRVFKDKKSALDSYRRGELDLGDRIVIKD